MKDKLNKIPEKIINFKNWRNIVAVSVLGLGYLTSCTDINANNDNILNPSQPPTPSPNIEITPNPTATSIPTEIPTPIIEPPLMPTQTSEILPVNPPYFNQENQNISHGSFDLIDAHAVYALYRQQEGPSMWTSDSQFVADMEAYSNQLNGQGIQLKQATREGMSRTLLVKDNQILLNFNQNGAIRDVNPGLWSPESTSTWVDVGAKAELYIGEDNNSYIAKLNQDGQVDAFLNPIGATLDNINDQWIPIQDGLPNAIWNDEAWSSKISIRAIVGCVPPQELDGYTTSSFEQIKNYPTTLTPSDMRDPNLGAIIRQNFGADQYGVWVVGEIAGYQYGKYTASGRTVQITEIAMDVPDKSGQQAIRILMNIFDESLKGSLTNLTELQTAAINAKETGLDPLDGLDNIDEFSPNGINLIDFNSGAVRFEKIVNYPSLIGSQFAFLMPDTAFKIDPYKNADVEIPNLALKIILDPSAKFSQNEFNLMLFDYWSYAVLPEMLK